MKVKKYLISLGTVAAAITPLAILVSCGKKSDELDFDSVSKDEFIFTNDMVKTKIVPIINDIEKFLYNELNKNYPVAEDDYDKTITKLAYFESKDSSIIPFAVQKYNEFNEKISKFEESVVGTNFNVMNRTYLKLKDYQRKIPIVIKNTAAGIWSFIYNNIATKALANQLVFSSLDNRVAKKGDVIGENLYWVDLSAAEKLFDATNAARAKAMPAQEPIPKPAAGVERTWNEIVSEILANAAGNPTDEQAIQPSPSDQVDWVEKWLNDNLVVWDGQKAVQGSIHTHVERGNVPSQLDVIKAKALVKSGQTNIVFDTVNQIAVNAGEYLIDSNHFRVKEVSFQVPDEYWKYIQSKYSIDISKMTNAEKEAAKSTIKDADDWNKLIDEIAKDKTNGRVNLNLLKTNIKLYSPLSELGSLVFQKLASYINSTTRVFFTKYEESAPDQYGQTLTVIDPETMFIDKSNVVIEDLPNSISLNVTRSLFDSLKPTSGTWAKTNTYTSGDSDATKLKKLLSQLVGKYGSSALESLLEYILFPAASVDYSTQAVSPKFATLVASLDDGYALIKDVDSNGNVIYAWSDSKTATKSKVIFDDDELSAQKIRDWTSSLATF